MKALLYAAGIGKRLEQKFGKRPKVLLEFGGRSVLEWHLTRLVEAGVTELVVVTGYCREMMETKLAGLAPRFPLRLRTVHNPDFTEGSVLSFHVALPELEQSAEPILLMDADVLYPAEMLRRLIASPHPTALLIDREFSTADDDPVLVPIRDGRPFDFVKKWTGEADELGESIGFFKVSAADLPALITETRRRATGAGRGDSYDDVTRVLVQDGRFGHEDVTGLPWTEIDFPEDVERAEREVLPAIERLGR
jgi:choline kinase